jgi:hypothetical protein
MKPSDRMIIAVALAPNVAMLAFLTWWMFEARFSLPVGLVIGLGVGSAMLGVGLANFIRLRRDGMAPKPCSARTGTQDTPAG